MKKLALDQPRTFKALPVTLGYQESDHDLTWTFSDGEIVAGNNCPKAFSTLGTHRATVVAVNKLTGGSGTASIDYEVITELNLIMSQITQNVIGEWLYDLYLMNAIYNIPNRTFEIRRRNLSDSTANTWELYCKLGQLSEVTNQFSGLFNFNGDLVISTYELGGQEGCPIVTNMALHILTSIDPETQEGNFSIIEGSDKNYGVVTDMPIAGGYTVFPTTGSQFNWWGHGFYNAIDYIHKSISSDYTGPLEYNDLCRASEQIPFIFPWRIKDNVYCMDEPHISQEYQPRVITQKTYINAPVPWIEKLNIYPAKGKIISPWGTMNLRDGTTTVNGWSEDYINVPGMALKVLNDSSELPAMISNDYPSPFGLATMANKGTFFTGIAKMRQYEADVSINYNWSGYTRQYQAVMNGVMPVPYDGPLSNGNGVLVGAYGTSDANSVIAAVFCSASQNWNHQSYFICNIRDLTKKYSIYSLVNEDMTISHIEGIDTTTPALWIDDVKIKDFL